MDLRPSQVRVGDILQGRYRLDEELGRGGFGAVFRAVDLPTGRTVALKELTSIAPTDRRRFEREARSLAQLDHPHIVNLYTTGTTSEGTPFVVLEHVEGTDLGDWLDTHGPARPAMVREAGRQLLSALEAVHRLGIVHRDIKPANIRLCAGPKLHLKLLDFGIAREERPGVEDRLTTTGELVGTPRYMSPEQLLGQPVTSRSDLYSVGLVLLEMLTGRAGLHGGSLPEQLERLQSGHLFSVPMLTSIGELEPVIMRLLARDPADRFGSATAALRALSTPEQPQTVTPARSESKTSSALAIAVIVLLLGGASIAWLVRTSDDVKLEPVVVPRGNVVREVAPQPQVRTDDATSVPAPAAQTGLHSDTVLDGLTGHRFWSYVPPSYDAAAEYAVIILLAPTGQPDAKTFLTGSGFIPLADELGEFIVLAPDVPGDIIEFVKRDGGAAIQRMVEHIADVYHVDQSRVFAVGHIGGGHAVRRLACHPWIAGTAAMTARPRHNLECAEHKPTLLLSPMRSRFEPVAGGVVKGCDVLMKKPILSLEEHEKFWLRNHECAGAPRQLDQSGGTCATWDCEHAPFVHCKLDGGHNWPGMAERVRDTFGCDGPPNSFPAARVIWDFFSSASVSR